MCPRNSEIVKIETPLKQISGSSPELQEDEQPITLTRPRRKWEKDSSVSSKRSLFSLAQEKMESQVVESLYENVHHSTKEKNIELYAVDHVLRNKDWKDRQERGFSQWINYTLYSSETEVIQS